MRNVKGTMAILLALFTLLMSLPFLVPHLGFLSLIGFVPLLFMDLLADSAKLKHFFWWYYAAFVCWNFATTFWVCNATVGGGIFACLANAFQMALVFALFRLSKKKFSGILPYIFLAAIWLAWERQYFSVEISWPWLTLGNAWATSIKSVQWYEFTGTLGGSLWIWVANISLFYLLLSLMGGHWEDINLWGKSALLLELVLVFVFPFVLSRYIYTNYEESQAEGIDVLIGQPNFDPYQKFESMSQKEQTAVLLDLFEKELENYEAKQGEPLLLLAPETFCSDVDVNFVQSGATFNSFTEFLSAYPNANILFGASSYEFIQSRTAPSKTARHRSDGLWLETHNSALITDNTARYQIFHKTKLVVGTEKTPYPGFFTKLDDKLGGVMGRCVGQKEISLLNCKAYDSDGQVTRDIPLGCAVCYESIYGEYCTGYVKKGARAMTVITNDAWWGNTPGYRQHLSYSRLRAVELRRDIARCGNTGISAIIDQRGEIVQKSDWWQRETLSGRINLNDKQTFFTRYGDIAGRVSTLVFLLMLLALIVRSITDALSKKKHSGRRR